MKRIEIRNLIGTNMKLPENSKVEKFLPSKTHHISFNMNEFRVVFRVFNGN